MRSLKGRRILLTRTKDGCAAWASRIEAAGGTPVSLPCIRVETLHDAPTRERLHAAIPAAEWITFGSRRGVEALAGLNTRLPDTLALAAVGDTTAAALRTAWGRVDLVAPGATAASLGVALLERLAEAANGSSDTPRVITIAASGGQDDIESALASAGVSFFRAELYRTVWQPANGSGVRNLVDDIDVVLLASPTAARGLVARTSLSTDAQVITIGPTTSAAAREAGLQVTAEARERSLDGLLEAIP